MMWMEECLIGSASVRINKAETGDPKSNDKAFKGISGTS